MEEKYLISEDHKHLFETTAEILIAQLLELSDKEHILFGLCGGRSVSGLLDVLAPSRSKIWRKVHFFLVDERMVPLDHPDSNYKLLHEGLFAPLLERAVIGEHQLHPFLQDESKQDYGVEEYSRQFLSIGDSFDIVVLSAGDDGHVASVFPNHKSAFPETTAVHAPNDQFIVVEDAPKPPPLRMSASIPLLARSHFGVGLFLGASKSMALKNFHNNDLEIEACPAKVLESMGDRLVVTDIELD